MMSNSSSNNSSNNSSKSNVVNVDHPGEMAREHETAARAVFSNSLAGVVAERNRAREVLTRTAILFEGIPEERLTRDDRAYLLGNVSRDIERLNAAERELQTIIDQELDEIIRRAKERARERAEKKARQATSFAALVLRKRRHNESG